MSLSIENGYSHIKILKIKSFSSCLFLLVIWIFYFFLTMGNWKSCLAIFDMSIFVTLSVLHFSLWPKYLVSLVYLLVLFIIQKGCLKYSIPCLFFCSVFGDSHHILCFPTALSDCSQYRKFQSLGPLCWGHNLTAVLFWTRSPSFCFNKVSLNMHWKNEQLTNQISNRFEIPPEYFNAFYFFFFHFYCFKLQNFLNFLHNYKQF